MAFNLKKCLTTQCNNRGHTNGDCMQMPFDLNHMKLHTNIYKNLLINKHEIKCYLYE